MLLILRKQKFIMKLPNIFFCVSAKKLNLYFSLSLPLPTLASLKSFEYIFSKDSNMYYSQLKPSIKIHLSLISLQVTEISSLSLKQVYLNQQ